MVRRCFPPATHRPDCRVAMTCLATRPGGSTGIPTMIVIQASPSMAGLQKQRLTRRVSAEQAHEIE
jgi:hypothetical protein